MSQPTQAGVVDVNDEGLPDLDKHHDILVVMEMAKDIKPEALQWLLAKLRSCRRDGGASLVAKLTPDEETGRVRIKSDNKDGGQNGVHQFILPGLFGVCACNVQSQPCSGPVNKQIVRKGKIRSNMLKSGSKTSQAINIYSHARYMRCISS